MGEVQRGSRGPVGLGAWGAAPAAAAKEGKGKRKEKEKDGEMGQVKSGAISQN